MKLSEVCVLLGDQSRYFADVYTQFQFKDDQDIQEYFDFILHEPIEWLKGFPSRLLKKGTFSRPKTATIRALKLSEVVQALGEDYTKKVHTLVWRTFKLHADGILQVRNKPNTIPVFQQITDAESIVENEILEHQSLSNHSESDGEGENGEGEGGGDREGEGEGDEEGDDRKVVREGRKKGTEKGMEKGTKKRNGERGSATNAITVPWETKYRVLDSVLQSVLEDTPNLPQGCQKAFRTLLSAFSSL